MRKESLKDSNAIATILGHTTSWDCYIMIDFNKKSDRIKYVARILLSFIVFLVVIGVSLLIFLQNGLILALAVYIAGLYGILGTGYIFLSQGCVKEIKN